MHTPLVLLVSLSSLVAAANPPEVSESVPESWSNRATFFVGARGGLAVPPGAIGLAPNIGLELGVAVNSGFGFGVRALWMNNPPGVPFLDLAPAAYGFGALADFRYYIETIDPLIIYPTISVGFLAGPERVSMQNAVLPLFNPGVGVKLKFGNMYAAFEFGASGFTIPFVVFVLGWDGDSKATKQAARARVATAQQPAPTPAPAPVVAPCQAPCPAPGQ